MNADHIIDGAGGQRRAALGVGGAEGVGRVSSERFARRVAAAAMAQTQAQTPYRLLTLNTLAFPKGKLPRCELTGLPAAVQCVTPHITLYYATKEHAEEAWHGIMHKIAPLR